MILSDGIVTRSMYVCIQFCGDNCFYFPFTQRNIFADDYNISLRSSDPNRAHRILQLTLNSISPWALKNGFQYLVLKTLLSSFSKKETHAHSPPCFYKDLKLPYTLGLNSLAYILTKNLHRPLMSNHSKPSVLEQSIS